MIVTVDSVSLLYQRQIIMTDNTNLAVFDRLPPYFIKENFFGQALVDRLLAHVAASKDAFQDATVASTSNDAEVKTAIRISRVSYEFGELKAEVKARFTEAFPEVLEQLGMPAFALTGTEREIVAHGDGAFYRRHIDTFTGSSVVSVRALTAVYYFHSAPKRFQGGALRLLPLRHAADNDTHLDIEPLNDRVLFFPSWVPHAVMPVSLQSTDFTDSRFAINCWYHKSR